MSRLARGAPLSIATAALIALAAPAAAHAAAYTIEPGGGGCGGGDTACGTFTEAAGAANAAADLDTFAVSAGSYDGGATFSNGNVQITGAPGVVVNGSLSFSGSGTSTLNRVNVIRATGATQTILVSGAASLQVSDSTVVSGPGDGILFASGVSNLVQRSNVISATAGGGAASAIRVATATGSVTLNIFSSFATGGLSGVRAESGQSGTATVNARHLTAAGSTFGLVADTTGDLPALGLGTVTFDVDNSIVFGTRTIDGGLLATESITFDAASVESQVEFSPSVLFAEPLNRNYRLRPGSPAIDAGGVTPGESPTDVDGQARAAAPTDLGADEYVNTPPTAALAVKTQIARDGQPVELDAGGSRDQPGGGIVSYRWEFGDTTTATTSAPTVTHTYKGEGPVTVKLTVVDNEGAGSAPATKAITIYDGSAPAVTIAKPKNKQKIFQFVRKTKTVTKNGKKVKVKVKTKTRTRIKLAGAATDKSGVSRVVLTVEKTANASTQSVVQGSQTATKKCRWLDPKTGLKRTSCNRPILILVKVRADGSWAYNVRKSIKLSTGTYRAVVYGLDKLGSFGNAAPKAERNIKFTIR